MRRSAWADNWETAWTLDDYVISLVVGRKTDTREFKTLMGIYGREKIEGIWKRYTERKKKEQREAPFSLVQSD